MAGLRKHARRSSMTIACAIAVTAATTAQAATYRFDNGAGTNVWNDPVNWNTIVDPDGVPASGDEVNADGLPGAADVASLNPTAATGTPLTVSLSDTRAASEVEVSNPAGAASNVSGTTTLNVQTGASLTVGAAANGSAGLRIGRSLAAGQTAPSQQGSVIQTGGTVFSRVRLSPESNSADSLYRISGGALVGATTVTPLSAGGTNAISDLIVGTTGGSFNRAEFHVNGSGASAIRFLDVQVADSNAVVTSSGGTSGRAVFHWTLDAGGTTPIVAEDEFQFRAGTAGAVAVGQLVVDMVADAPTSDVTLVIADRLGNNASALERFANYSTDLAPLSVVGPNYTYNYLLDYQDGSDNFTGDPTQLDAYIILRYQGRVAVPEPASLAAIGLLGGLILRRRRSAR